MGYKLGSYGMAGWQRFDSGTRKLPYGMRPMHLDPTTHAQVAIDAEHHEIHEGHMWHAFDTDTDVDTGAPKEWLIVTPALNPDVSAFGYDNKDFRGYYVHFAGSLISDTDYTVQLFEDTEVSDNGVEVTSKYWRNRNRADTEILTVWYRDPTVTTDGTELENTTINTTTNPIQSIGGIARTESEWVLKPATNYLIRVTVTADNAIVTLNTESYEHPHKDDWWEPSVR